MTPERWQRVQELFAAAVERRGPERDAYLESACAADQALRREVESLLAAHAQAGDFIDTPAFRFSPAAPPEATTPAPAAAGAGRRFGPYEVIALLGAGGMGEVYRARDPRLGREVAIKILPREAVEDQAQLRRFEHEARAVGALNHPNILAVYDVGREGAEPYVVTELLEGETLQARLASGPLEPEETLALARQIAAGLAAAHDKGIVHRDLKPGNLFITTDGRLKILDFGLAKRQPGDPGALAATASGHTLPGLILGTAGYMSPEQVRGQPVDRRSDVFSFGAVLYETLAGQRAFSGGSAVETMSAVLNQEPPPLASLGRPAPAAVEALVRGCLRKQPEARFQSGRELAAALAALERDLAHGAVAAAMEPAVPRTRHTVAVLPFVNLSGDPEDDYFGEGMAEELTNALGRIEELRVVARLSTAQLRGRGADLQALAERHGVDKVLEGSVRRAGNRLRITVQLVNLADGLHLWSEKYDREMSDVFALQDEIAQRVIEALRLRLAGSGRPARRRPTDNLDAYHLYLRGRHHWNKRYHGALEEGVRCFQQAIDHDPAYALAYAGLAESYSLMGHSHYDLLAPQEALPRARAAARRALELDPDLADAHACLGWIALHYDWDFAAAEAEFARALELEPGRALTHHWRLFLLAARGEFDAATAASRRAWELDPLSLIVNAGLAAAHYYARRYDQCIQEARKLEALEPEFPVAHNWLGTAYAAQGRFGEAIPELEAFARLAGGGSRGRAIAGYARGAAGERAAALAALAELRATAERRYVPAFHFALVHLGLGEREAALAELEQAAAERCDQIAYLGVDPLFDPLRDHPRFRDLLQRAGLPRSVVRESAPPAARPKAIAVLPFRDLARDPANEHLGLGLADATITELALLKSLVVRPTSAILRYQRAPADPVQAARELGVSAVLDGAFQRAGTRLRVTVQLVSGDDGHPLWASKIDTSLEDLFRMQDEVSRSVAQALEIQLSPRERRALQRPRAARAPAGEAYELYLKGRVHLFLESLEECLLAVDCFDQACAADPDFALGWAGLADAYARIAFTFLPEGDWYARAWAACEKALALDPELPEARYVRGGRLRWSPQAGFDHAGALRDLVPAIAARPSLEEAHVRLGVILHHLGLIDEVERELEQALVISPGHALARQHQGLCLYTRGKYDQALAIYEEAARQAPLPWIYYRIALCQIQLGRREAADLTVERMQRHAPGDVLAHPILGLLAALRGDAEEARRQTALTVERRRDFGHYHHALFDLGCIAAQLGDTAGAVAWLREAAGNGFPCAPDFARDPLLAPLRGDADYRALVAELEADRRRYAALYAELRAATPSSESSAPRAGAGAGARAGTALAAAPDRARPLALAVLPFRDRSPGSEHEHLRLGLADALIGELAAVRELRVRPTAAILRFLDSSTDAAAAGRELGADHVLAGQFKRTASGLNVAVRLVAAATGQELWSGELEAPARGLPALVGDLARRVATALRVAGGFQRLDALLAERSPAAEARLSAAAAPAPEVYELCLKGRVLLFREGLLDIVAAVDCFEKARESDPQCAPAWAGLADAYARLAFDHQPEGNWYRRATAMADRALALDPDLPEGRYVRARLMWSPHGGFDHAGALRELRAALATRPELFEARFKMASILLHVGLLEESARLHLDLLAESPGHPTVTGYFGLCRYAQGRYAEALELSESAARALPLAWFAYQAELCRLHLGSSGEAPAEVRHMHPVRGLRAALAGDPPEARREAALIAENLRPYGHFHHAQYDIACIHALLGEIDPALEWLTAAARNGFPCAPQFAGDPWLAALRGEPRFMALIDELEAERERYAALYPVRDDRS